MPARACRGVLGECETEQGTELDCAERRRSYRAPKLVEDVALRLSQDPASTGMELAANESHSARAHGELRYLQGYTPAMLAHESRILQVTISGTLQSSLNHLDFRPAAARRHGHRGQSGFPFDPGHGKLHESNADVGRVAGTRDAILAA